jgi:hypothetical protein
VLPASGALGQVPPDGLATHKPPAQQPPVQELSAQHDSPNPPHTAQNPCEHVLLAAVQLPVVGSLPQQARPGAPQFPQTPALHTPLPHEAPLATHILETQQPPSEHALPAQHA